jgi:predicted RNA polymerase sigma factor
MTATAALPPPIARGHLRKLLDALAAPCLKAPRAARGETHWEQIVAQYDELLQRMPSPVVELNRAVAVGMAFGPSAALPLVDALVAGKALQRYHLLGAVRGDLLLKLGRRAEARSEFERAAELTGNARERALLQARARAAVSSPPRLERRESVSPMAPRPPWRPRYAAAGTWQASHPPGAGRSG